MSQSEIERFAKDIKVRPELQAGLVATGAHHGYNFSVDDVKAFFATAGKELSVAALEKVSGGRNPVM